MKSQKVSVIIPVYNREKIVKDCIIALWNQNYPQYDYEIIIVDDGSTDKTLKILHKFEKEGFIKVLEQEHKGPSAARNLGAKKAKGDILLFTDSDCIPNKNWIKLLTAPFKDENVIATSGTYRTKNIWRPIARFVGYEIAERHKKLGKETDFVSTFSAAFRKDIYLKVGGLDEKFIRASADDTSLSFKLARLGKKMIFVPQAWVYHYHPDNLKEYLKRKFWMGYWRVFLYRDFKEKFMRHSYTPKSLYAKTALSGLTFLSLILALFGIISLNFFLVSLLILFLSTLPFSIKILRNDKIVGFLSPLIIILRDFVTGWGILFGILNLLLKER